MCAICTTQEKNFTFKFNVTRMHVYYLPTSNVLQPGQVESAMRNIIICVRVHMQS